MGAQEADRDDRKNVSFRWDRERVQDFEDAIWNAKVDGEFDRDASRSDVLRALCDDFIEEHEDAGNENRRGKVAAD